MVFPSSPTPHLWPKEWKSHFKCFFLETTFLSFRLKKKKSTFLKRIPDRNGYMKWLYVDGVPHRPKKKKNHIHFHFLLKYFQKDILVLPFLPLQTSKQQIDELNNPFHYFIFLPQFQFYIPSHPFINSETHCKAPQNS